MEHRLKWEGPFISQDKNLMSCYRIDTPIGRVFLNFSVSLKELTQFEHRVTSISFGRFTSDKIEGDFSVDEAKKIAEDWLFEMTNNFNKLFDPEYEYRKNALFSISEEEKIISLYQNNKKPFLNRNLSLQELQEIFIPLGINFKFCNYLRSNIKYDISHLLIGEQYKFVEPYYTKLGEPFYIYENNLQFNIFTLKGVLEYLKYVSFEDGKNQLRNNITELLTTQEIKR